MRSGKLIKILKKFNIKQFKSLVVFSESLYFNKNTDVSIFLKILMKIVINGDDKKLSEEYLLKKIYPEQPFDKAKLYYLRSYTLNIVEKFIALQSFENESFTQHYELLQFYNEQNMPEYFEQEYNTTLKFLAQNAINDGKSNHKRFLIAWEKIQNEFQSNQRNNINLNEVHEYLDISYMINKLSLSISSLSLKNIIQTQDTNSLSPTELLQMIEKFPFLKEHQTIKLLAAHLMLLLYPDVEIYFEEANKLLLENKNALSKEASVGLFTHLRNYYIKKMIKGEEEAVEKLFTIYNLQIEEGLIFDKEQTISIFNFKNIANVGLKLKKYEWTKDFIENYQGFLPQTQKEDTLAYIWAEYFFEIKNWKEVLKFLFQIKDYPDSFFDINSRKLLIKTYYELSEIENVLNSLNSFRTYLYRNQKISANHKRSYLNFASAMTKLALLDWQDKQKVQTFLLLIGEMDNFNEKVWFQEKILTTRRNNEMIFSES